MPPGQHCRWAGRAASPVGKSQRDVMGPERSEAIKSLRRDELRKAMSRADICPLGGYLMNRDIVHLGRRGEVKRFPS